MSVIKVSARWVPSKGCERESVPCLSPSFWWFVGNLWPIEASPQSLPSSSHGVLPVCVSVSKFSSFIRTLVILS